ncbi:hypothetical protein [Acinetobacter baumannii]
MKILIALILTTIPFTTYAMCENERNNGTALLHKDLKVKTSHIYSNLSDNSGMWSA